MGEPTMEVLVDALRRRAHPILQALSETHEAALSALRDRVKPTSESVGGTPLDWLEVAGDQDPLCLPTECLVDIMELVLERRRGEATDDGPNRNLSNFTVTVDGKPLPSPSHDTIRKALEGGKAVRVAGDAEGMVDGCPDPRGKARVNFRVVEVMESDEGSWKGLWVQSALVRGWYRIEGPSHSNEEGIKQQSGRVAAAFPDKETCSNPRPAPQGSTALPKDNPALLEGMAKLFRRVAARFHHETSSKPLVLTDPERAAVVEALPAEVLAFAAPFLLANPGDLHPTTLGGEQAGGDKVRNLFAPILSGPDGATVNLFDTDIPSTVFVCGVAVPVGSSGPGNIVLFTAGSRKIEVKDKEKRVRVSSSDNKVWYSIDDTQDLADSESSSSSSDSSSSLGEYPQKAALAASVKVRSGESASSPVIAKLSKGEVVIIARLCGDRLLLHTPVSGYITASAPRTAVKWEPGQMERVRRELGAEESSPPAADAEAVVVEETTERGSQSPSPATESAIHETMGDDTSPMQVDSQGSSPIPPRKRKKQVVEDESDSESSSSSSSSSAPQRKKLERKAPVKRTSSTASRGSKIAKLPSSTGSTRAANFDKPRPVISDPQEMFHDMVREIGSKFPKLLPNLGGWKRPLRVATMCSGTESPLLALAMFSKALKEQKGYDFLIEHVFSCEIEPFKQAYIERNFSPKILFRDVTELCNDYAHTAYAGLVKVPGNCDVLIAGTSCKDFSGLNNHKKTIHQEGQSGQTFRGMLSWVKKFKPPLVVLENVKGAPWKTVVETFENLELDGTKKKYTARHVALDTKMFYVPQTRQRGYMCAVLEGDHNLEKWFDVLMKLQRPSSSTLDAFMLPPDDPRVHRVAAAVGATKKSSRVDVADWGRCELRHAHERSERGLGAQRPLTRWDESGGVMGPDWAWHAWLKQQTPRVKDVLDCNYLKAAKGGNRNGSEDAYFRTKVWNVSQNVDRQQETSVVGVCPCLTPCMIPFIPNRGGPITGAEALALQGIPADRLLLTRETEKELADLAGNAMTTTVVGAVTISSLLVYASKLLPHLCDPLPAGAPSPDLLTIAGSNMVQQSDKTAVEQNLAEQAVKPPSNVVDLTPLYNDRDPSALKCACEAGGGVTDKEIFVCRLCRHTACSACKGNPEHDYQSASIERTSPLQFQKQLSSALPTRLHLTGTEHFFSTITRPAEFKEKDWEGWRDVVQAALKSEYRFRKARRGRVWFAEYGPPSGQGASLRVLLHPTPEWHLFVDPPIDASPELRSVLELPVAVAKSTPASLVSGTWQIRRPSSPSIHIRITAAGEQVESWEESLGLEGVGDKKRWSRVKVKVEAEGHAALEARISGEYTLLPKCGGATGLLYRRDGPEDMFFFLNPSRVGRPCTDSMVFADDCEKLNYGEVRNPLVVLSAGWRIDGKKEEQRAKATIPGDWVPLDASVSLQPLPARTMVALPSNPPSVVLNDCHSPIVVIRCAAPLPRPDKLWPESRSNWVDAGIGASRNAALAFAWLINGMAIPPSIEEWVSVTSSSTSERCQRCAPTPPPLKFEDKKGIPTEDGAAAAVYEQTLKARPPTFELQLKSGSEETPGQIRVCVNPATLLQRARLSMPEKGQEKASYSWRIQQHTETQGDGDNWVYPSHTLLSNRLDKEAPQPPHFKKHRLRPEQLRSVQWMLSQEADTTPFMQQEVEEVVNDALQWRLEARMQLPVVMRGGILADEVGYGKTAVTLGLVDSAPPPPPPPAEFPETFVTKATLVIAPAQLLAQWPSEVTKFLGKTLDVITVKSQANLSSLKPRDIHSADLVIISSRVLCSKARLEAVGSGNKAIQTGSGRKFEAAYKEAVAALPDRVKRGKVKDASALEAFHWNRIVVDEFTFLSPEDVMVVRSLQSHFRWLLSGTPIVSSFNDVRSIAELLGIWLGVPDHKLGGARSKTMTKAEYFHILQTVRTAAWHATRHAVADKFLKRYMRQNIAEIEEIPTRAVNIPIDLTTAHRAVYVELEAVVQALELNKNFRRWKKNSAHGDRDRRLAALLGSSGSADEALLKCAATFALGATNEEEETEEEHLAEKKPVKRAAPANKGAKRRKKAVEEDSSSEDEGGKESDEDGELSKAKKRVASIKNLTATDVCKLVESRRQSELDSCRKALVDLVVEAEVLLNTIRRNTRDPSYWGKYQGWYKSAQADDIEVSDILDGVIKEASKRARDGEKASGKGAKELKSLRKVSTKDETEADPNEKMKFHLSEMTHNLRAVAKELVGRKRSLRFFNAVRKMQGGGEMVCDMCSKVVPKEQQTALTCCGHVGHMSCLQERIDNGKGCPAKGCSAQAKPANIVRIDRLLGQEGATTKLERVVELIKRILRENRDDRILVFCQFDDLTEALRELFDDTGIKAAQVQGSVFTKLMAITDFLKETAGKQVLLLPLNGESASGLNLTIANHIIFVHPLLSTDTDEFRAIERQAVGRARRYGQTKTVHVYRFLSESTVDDRIYEEMKESQALAIDV